jgi:hypothetical protein
LSIRGWCGDPFLITKPVAALCKLNATTHVPTTGRFQRDHVRAYTDEGIGGAASVRHRSSGSRLDLDQMLALLPPSALQEESPQEFMSEEEPT